LLLPKELWVVILGYCNPIDREAAQYSLVSKLFKKIIDSELWRDLCKRDFPRHHTDRLHQIQANCNPLLKSEWQTIYRDLVYYRAQTDHERCDQSTPSKVGCISCGETRYCAEICMRMGGNVLPKCPHLWCPECTPECLECDKPWCGACYDDMGGDSIVICKCGRHVLLSTSNSWPGYCLYCACRCESCGEYTGRANLRPYCF